MYVSAQSKRLILTHALLSDYRGPADPLRGEAPSQRVRDAAKEALTALFNGPSEELRQQRSTVTTNSATSGFGSDSMFQNQQPSERLPFSGLSHSDQGFSSGTYGGPSVSNGMGGFGSEPQQPKNAATSVLTQVGDKFKSLFSEKQQTSTFAPIEQPSEYQAPGQSFSSQSMSSISSSEWSSSMRQRGQVGGGWDSAPAPSLSGASGSSAFASVQSISSPVAAPVTDVPTDFETRLVDSLCLPTGIRTAPTKEETAKFVQQTSSLNSLAIANLLLSKIAPGSALVAQMVRSKVFFFRSPAHLVFAEIRLPD